MVISLSKQAIHIQCMNVKGNYTTYNVTSYDAIALVLCLLLSLAPLYSVEN